MNVSLCVRLFVRVFLDDALRPWKLSGIEGKVMIVYSELVGQGGGERSWPFSRILTNIDMEWVLRRIFGPQRDEVTGE